MIETHAVLYVLFTEPAFRIFQFFNEVSVMIYILYSVREFEVLYFMKSKKCKLVFR